MPTRPSLRLAFAVLAFAARAAAEEPAGAPPVTLPEPGSTPATAPGGRGGGWGPRRAPSDEVTYTPTVFARDAFPLAGFHQERFYLRDPEDRVRIFPGGLLQLDTRAAFGRGVGDVTGPRGEALQPRLAVRRARLDLGGQIHRSWSFFLSGEFAGPAPRVEYALVDIEFHRLLRLSLGQQLVPFSQANRTFEPYLPWMERPLAVRFVLPDDKDLGAMLWGDTRRGVFAYEVGVFGGDGRKANVDRAVDVAGRVVLKPLASTSSIAQHIQIGGSGMYGVRQLDRVDTPLAPLTTEGGFAFWDPRRGEGADALTALPSGRQMAFAGEVRVPVSQLDLRFEFVHASKQTREALVGQERGVSERFGTLEGNALYAHLGLWLLGSPALLEQAGRFRPPRVRFPRGLRPLDERGLMLALRFESLNATYAPGDRASAPGDERPRRDIKARVFGAGLNYYAGRHMAVLLHYSTSIFPDSSVPQLDPSNLAVAPGNLVGRSGARQLHEAGGRVQVFF